MRMPAGSTAPPTQSPRLGGPPTPGFSDALLTFWCLGVGVGPAAVLIVAARSFLSWPEPSVSAVVTGLATL